MEGAKTVSNIAPHEQILQPHEGVNDTEMSGGEAFMAYVSRNDDDDDE